MALKSIPTYFPPTLPLFWIRACESLERPGDLQKSLSSARNEPFVAQMDWTRFEILSNVYNVPSPLFLLPLP